MRPARQESKLKAIKLEVGKAGLAPATFCKADQVFFHGLGAAM